MKLLGVTFLIFMAVGSSSAGAQSCAAPIPFLNQEQPTGDTCTAQNELGTLCIFALSPSNDIIYSMTVAASTGAQM